MPRPLACLFLLLPLLPVAAPAAAQEGGGEGGPPPAGADLIRKLGQALEGKGALDRIPRLCPKIQDYAKS
ncbi:MAG: hypothetical protein ACE5JG_12250, partial [Planctomycetota bacterium]